MRKTFETDEINGIQYILFQTDIAINEYGLKYAERLEEKIRKFNGIEIHNEVIRSFWTSDIARIKFLIPSENAFNFSEYKINRV